MLTKINETAALLTVLAVLFVMLNPKESRLWVMFLTMGILRGIFCHSGSYNIDEDMGVRGG